jgi:sulfoxide reductase catalytic subunit YedY
MRARGDHGMVRRRSLPSSPPSSEITPQAVYLNRRGFLRAAGLAGASALLAACGAGQQPTPTEGARQVTQADELGDPLTDLETVTGFNNFYEFTTSKQGVADLAEGFRTQPWTVEVSGLVHRPATFAIDDLLSAFSQEERAYRLRCVEAWSMVIPWMGFELGRLLDQVEPMTSAAFVGFTTLLDPDQMPGQRSSEYPWPYTEGLRLDEAMHALTLLATGLYGEPLLPQNGAPLRLVVPWKYGFKSVKSIVHIDLLERPPATFWNTIAPQEYGFYANVNPEVGHPRWSQASETRLGVDEHRDTLMFNGYSDQVGGLYAGMDLDANY